jgi:hypothetical protein
MEPTRTAPATTAAAEGGAVDVLVSRDEQPSIRTGRSRNGGAIRISLRRDRDARRTAKDVCGLIPNKGRLLSKGNVQTSRQEQLQCKNAGCPKHSDSHDRLSETRGTERWDHTSGPYGEISIQTATRKSEVSTATSGSTSTVDPAEPLSDS